MRFNYCPNCGTQLPITTHAFAPQTCASCGVTHYQNSKPCAGALMVKDGSVLLVKRAVEPFKDCWDIPGGFLEAGEHPLHGMIREMREELGLSVRVIELLGVYMDRYGNEKDAVFTLNAYYVVEPLSGEPRAKDDVGECRWFRLDEFPPQMAFEHEKQVLEDLKKVTIEDTGL